MHAKNGTELGECAASCVRMYYVHVYQLSQRQVTIIHIFLPLLSFLLIYYTIVIIIACKHDAHLNYVHRL